MNIGQVKDLSPQNLFHKLEVQISCWIWAQTNPEHIFTSWIQANLCGERNQVAPNRSPDWDVHSRFSNLFQPRATSSSYMLLSPLVTLVSQSVLKQDSHATPITMVLVGATLFLAKRKCGDAFLESTSCSCASYISSYFSFKRVSPFIICTSPESQFSTLGHACYP